MKKLALVTCEKLRALTLEDRLLADHLRGYDIEATAAVWDDDDVDWRSFDSAVIRTCWDYHHRPAEFAAWLEKIEKLGVPLWNPAPVVRWNMEKTYLRALSERGVDIVPTVWVEAGEAVDLASVLEERGWRRAVVKPVISASAHQTWATGSASADEESARLREMARSGGVLIQPFVEEVPRAGEWSIIFFNRRYSHSVLKRAKRGEFRVQSEYGGSVEFIEPPPALLETARGILAHIREPLLLARVDGVEINGRFVLMELELIESALFMESRPDALDAFARAIVERLMVFE